MKWRENMVNHDYINKEKVNIGPLFIAIAACMWGTIGIFGTFLINQGLSPSLTGCLKLLGSSFILFLYFLNGKTSYLKIRWHDFSWLVAMALSSQAIFNFSYYTVVGEMGVTKAGILMYTMPIFLVLWSILLFNEKMTVVKVLGICLSFVGSAIALTGGVLDLSTFTAKGIFLGLVSAVSFSSMSVFSKILLKKLPPLTVIFYAFLLGGLMMLPFVDLVSHLPQILTMESLGSIFGIAFIGSVLPYILYFRGIDMGVDLSKAGVISVMELVTSIVLATVILGEHLNGIKLIGIGLIIGAIVIIQKRK
jgi:drug/metabolite transporter (DMT)-like permease